MPFNRLICFIGLILTLATSNAFARDTKQMFSIQEAMNSSDFQEKLDPNIKLVFGQSASGITKTFSKVVTNKKTNAFMKSDDTACQWVLLSALLQLQEKAKSLGANAVVDIASYYKKNRVSSTTEYECHAGNVLAGVALEGQPVVLK